MSKKLNGRGVSRLEWLDAGLDTLTRYPATGIRVEKLASTLGIARAGFYWHFKNRDDYIGQLLEYWLHKVTEAIVENPDIIAMEPKARLIATAEIIHDNELTRAHCNNCSKLAPSICFGFIVRSTSNSLRCFTPTHIVSRFR